MVVSCGTVIAYCDIGPNGHRSSDPRADPCTSSAIPATATSTRTTRPRLLSRSTSLPTTVITHQPYDDPSAGVTRGCRSCATGSRGTCDIQLKDGPGKRHSSAP